MKGEKLEEVRCSSAAKAALFATQFTLLLLVISPSALKCIFLATRLRETHASGRKDTEFAQPLRTLLPRRVSPSPITKAWNSAKFFGLSVDRLRRCAFALYFSATGGEDRGRSRAPRIIQVLRGREVDFTFSDRAHKIWTHDSLLSLCL